MNLAFSGHQSRYYSKYRCNYGKSEYNVQNSECKIFGTYISKKNPIRISGSVKWFIEWKLKNINLSTFWGSKTDINLYDISYIM